MQAYSADLASFGLGFVVFLSIDVVLDHNDLKREQDRYPGVRFLDGMSSIS